MKPAPIFDAVTAVLVHDGEIFLARRQLRLAAFPGYHAFPGGKVDRGDSSEPLPQPVFAGHEPRLIRALSRELHEELCYDLIANANQVRSIRQIGVALTPPAAPVRFNTYFFRVDLDTRPEFSLCEPEIESGGWASAAGWLEQYLRGELLLAPPTWAAVNALGKDPHAVDAGFTDFGDPSLLRPFEAVHGVRQYFVRSNTIPPAMHTNCFLLGDPDAHRVLVDPSPNSPEELERLLQATGSPGFQEVFLTHHHPDHRQFADEVARRRGVPIGMSADTLQRIRKLQPEFATDLEVKIYAEGDSVTRWLGHAVRAIAVPGHDEGQLALMPDNKAWCIVGDLIQGVGTVVISPPEGDMRKYFATLERIIALQPRAIYPSHGLALGGVHYLEQALHHRRMRETQIKTLFDAGRSMDEILAEVYVGVEPHLLPLARINIESHLEKLRQDGAIA